MIHQRTQSTGQRPELTLSHACRTRQATQAKFSQQSHVPRRCGRRKLSQQREKRQVLSVELQALKSGRTGVRLPRSYILFLNNLAKNQGKNIGLRGLLALPKHPNAHP